MSLKERKKEREDEGILAQISKLVEQGRRGWSKEELEALAALAQGKTAVVATKETQPNREAILAAYDLVARLDAAAKGNKQALDGWA